MGGLFKKGVRKTGPPHSLGATRLRPWPQAFQMLHQELRLPQVKCCEDDYGQQQSLLMKES